MSFTPTDPPTITQFPPPYPNSETQLPEVFKANANRQGLWQPVLAADTAAAAAWMKTTADGTLQNAQEAAQAAEAALAAGNYQGEWSSLTGAYNKGISVRHGGQMWLLLTDLSDITSSEPAADNPDWQSLTGLLGASESIGTASITTAPLGSLRYFAGTHADAVAQGLPDLDAGGSDPVHWEVFTHGTETRTLQQATQLLEIDGERGQTFINIKEGSTWQGWQAVVGGGGGPTYPAHDFGIDSGCTDIADWTELDPAPANPGPHYEIEFTLDCSLHNYWLGYTNEAPSSPNAAYPYECDLVFNILNLPPTASEGFVGFIEWRSLAKGSDPTQNGARYNVVTPVFEVPAGWTFEWTGQVGAPTLGSTSTEMDIIQIKALQGVKVLQASLVGVRRD